MIAFVDNSFVETEKQEQKVYKGGTIEKLKMVPEQNVKLKKMDFWFPTGRGG